MSKSPHRPRTLVLDDRERIIRSAPGCERLRELTDLEFLDERLSESHVDTSRVEVLMAVRERTALPAEVLAQFPELRLLVQTGGHAYHLDVEEATRRGIPVTLSRRAAVIRNAMPELTMMLALTALRRLPEARAALDSSEPWLQPTGRILHGRRLGLLGVGRHGQGVVRLARAFGMEVVGWSRTGRTSIDVDGDPVPLLPMEELLTTSDVVSIHLRLSEESRGLLDRRRLASMKPGSILVNTSRGAIVDEPALARALADGPLAGAGLDVFTEEPLPADSPLRSLPNVVLSPHIGWTVEEVFEEFASIATEQVAAFLDGTLERSELQNPDVELTPGNWGGIANGD